MAEHTRLAALDGLRGCCALIVVLHHLATNYLFIRSQFWLNSWLFVDFFFVLSGLVMAATYGGRLNRLADLSAFMIRRFARVWPLHAVVLLAMASFHVLLGLAALTTGQPYWPFTDDHSLSSLGMSLLLLQAVFPFDGTWNTPAWSISVEFYTYLLFGVVAYFPFRPARSAAVLVLVAAAILMLTHTYFTTSSAPFAILRCIVGFFLGCLLCELRPTLVRWLEHRDGLLSILQICGALAVIVYVHFVGYGPSTMIAPLLFAGVVAAFSIDRGMGSRILLAPAFQRLGQWSFAIYICHIPLLNIMRRLYGAAVGVGVERFGAGTSLTLNASFVCIFLGALFLLAAFSYAKFEVVVRDAIITGYQRWTIRRKRHAVAPEG